MGGSSKAAEGHLAEVCFNKAKEEEMVIAVNSAARSRLMRPPA